MPTVDQFDGYCSDIGAPDSTRMRCRSLILLGEKFVGKKIQEVLLEDALNDEGVRQFLNLACFWDDGTYLDLPLPEPNWYTSHLVLGRISTIRVKGIKEFDFVETKPDSRMEIQAERDGNRVLNLNATGKNCQYMMDATRKYLFPLLKK